MSKPEKYYLEGKNYYLWDYEEQTQMKHKVVKEYFKVWATKLGRYYKVYYFDCFGGCGAYLEGGNIYYGSPFLAAEVATELRETLGRDIEILVTEADNENYENLKKVRVDLQDKLTVLPRIGNMKFEEYIKKDWMVNTYRNPNSPVFFLIDPFGYSLNFEDIDDIMKYQKNEMVINFMFDYISRFIGVENNPKLEETYDRFFGCKEWREARTLAGFEREKKLVDVYKQRLKKNAKYVFPYKLSFPDKDRTYYYLFHVTNNIDGCSIMKAVFANLNCGRVEYLGKKGDELTLFDMQEFKISDIKSFLLGKYSGKCISFMGIVEEIIDDTLFLEKDIRKALKELKQEGLVTIISITSKTDRGLQGDDKVLFGTC